METQPIALITGANKGIGLETARQLGRLQYKILLGARDAGRGEEAIQKLRAEHPAIDVDLLVLDVADEKSIEAAKNTVAGQFGRLDVLVNNAGIFLEKDLLPSEVSLSIVRQTFEVNFFGLFALTTALLPLLKKAPAGRIVNVSSGQGSLTRNSAAENPRLQLGYDASKAAVNALTIQFAKELKDTPVKINSAAPGYTITDMNGGAGKQTVEQAAGIIVRLATLDGEGVSGGFFEEEGEVPW